MYTYNNSIEYSKLENTFEYQANIPIYRIFKYSSQHFLKVFPNKGAIVGDVCIMMSGLLGIRCRSSTARERICGHHGWLDHAGITITSSATSYSACCRDTCPLDTRKICIALILCPVLTECACCPRLWVWFPTCRKGAVESTGSTQTSPSPGPP